VVARELVAALNFGPAVAAAEREGVSAVLRIAGVRVCVQHAEAACENRAFKRMELALAAGERRADLGAGNKHTASAAASALAVDYALFTAPCLHYLSAANGCAPHVFRGYFLFLFSGYQNQQETRLIKNLRIVNNIDF
jgi:hypothetical protein